MLAGVAVGLRVSEPLAPVFFVTAVIVSMSLKMANLWQQFVLLTLGKLRSGTGRACSPSVETPAAPETA